MFHALLRRYARIAPGSRGAYRLVRAARRLTPADRRRGWFRTPHGFEMELDLDVYPDCTMAFGLYELETVRVIRRLLGAGDHFVDGGANLGYFSLLAARCVGPTGRVDAFEPEPTIRRRLTAHVERNRLGGIVHVHDAALADGSGHAQLHRSPDTNHGKATLFPHRQHRPHEPHASVTVRTARLDDALPESARPRVIKLDLEGAEPLAIAGMSRLLHSDASPTLVLEYNALAARAAGCEPVAAIDGIRAIAPGYTAHVIAWRLRPLRDADPAIRRGEANVLLNG